jgi:formamidopyrimidine-DNA glycosylase
VGNLYASEILHRARVHPARPCEQLRPEHWRRVHCELRAVLEEAIEHEGSTLVDGTYRVQREGRYQTYHRVYQRAGQSCLQCGRGSIVRIVQAQRSTFFCPCCQRQGPGTRGQGPGE